MVPKCHLMGKHCGVLALGTSSWSGPEKLISIDGQKLCLSKNVYLWYRIFYTCREKMPLFTFCNRVEMNLELVDLEASTHIYI